MKLYIIEWWDHVGDAGWVEHPEKMKPARCKTIGWLVHEDKESIKLADTLTDDDGVGGISLILKSAIIKKRKLEV